MSYHLLSWHRHQSSKTLFLPSERRSTSVSGWRNIVHSEGVREGGEGGLGSRGGLFLVRGQGRRPPARLPFLSVPPSSDAAVMSLGSIKATPYSPELQGDNVNPPLENARRKDGPEDDHEGEGSSSGALVPPLYGLS